MMVSVLPLKKTFCQTYFRCDTKIKQFPIKEIFSLNCLFHLPPKHQIRYKFYLYSTDYRLSPHVPQTWGIGPNISLNAIFLDPNSRVFYLLLFLIVFKCSSQLLLPQLSNH